MYLENKIKVSAYFYLRSSIDKNGLSTVNIRVKQERGPKIDKSLGIKRNREEWHGGNKVDQELLKIKENLFAFIEAQQLLGNETSLKKMLDSFFDKGKVEVLRLGSLLDVYQNWQNNRRLSHSTKKTIKSRVKFLKLFFKYKKILNLPIHDVDSRLSEWLKEYSLHYLNHSRNTTNKVLKVLHHSFQFAFNEGYINSNPIKVLVSATVPLEINYLDHQELDLVRQHNFGSSPLKKSKDLFLFQSNTGISYADLSEVGKYCVKKTEDNQEYLRIKRKKTGMISLPPLTEETKEILEKYDYDLPIMSNQKYNMYLKEIASIIGISKRMTSHTARRTAGSMYLNMGLSYESVAAILGHNSPETTRKYYARVTPKRVLREYNQVIINNTI